MRDCERIGVHCLAGASYGSGAALITDELPMLIDFRDVYWTPEGRWAVNLALSVIVAGGAYFTGLAVSRHLLTALCSTQRVRLPRRTRAEL